MYTGKKLNLDNPQTYCEKLNWLKLYYHNPLFTQMVDKYEAKKYVSDLIGEEHIIPTLDVYESFDEIDFSKLPKQFVLKTTHNSGGIVICKDKETFDKEAAKSKLMKSLKHDYYKFSKEWPYKNVHPRIIAEQYMEDETGELKDYKWFCFNGEPKALFIASDRQSKDEETKFDFFDMNFNHIPMKSPEHPNAIRPIAKPRGFDEMKVLAAKLAEGLPHVRVDLYDIKGQLYFGELTFFHDSGFFPFEPEEWERKFGEWITLPTKME